MEYDIFISYSRADSAIVNTFVQQLESAGYKVWIDKAGVYSGSQFKRVIVQAIEDSKVFLFFSSKNSNTSPWTANEIGIAVNRKKPIIPIKLDNTRYNPSVEFDLINLDFVDYCSSLDCNLEMNKLMRTLEMYFAKAQTHPRLQYPQPHLEQAANHVQKNDTAQLSFFQKNRGCVITLTVMSSILLACIPLYFLSKLLFSSSYNSAPTNEDELALDAPSYSSDKDDDNYLVVAAEPQLIDLGLPSGTLWLDRNLGANSPEEPGMYLAWGETEEKDEYSMDTYFSKERIDNNFWLPKIVKREISGTKYDAATVILGPSYRMPTKEDMIELIKSCTWDYTKFNGRNGFEVTGPNGQSIFLPDCGHMDNVSLKGVDAYWTSTVTDYSPWILTFEGQIDRHELSDDFMSVENGLPIRPISKK
jgi:hypothetical protein